MSKVQRKAAFALLKDLNGARENPGRYARYLQREIHKVYSPQSLPMLKQTEGIKALEVCIAALSGENALPPLPMSEGLLHAAQDHAEYLGKTGEFSHFGANRSGPKDRISKYGKVYDHFEVCIAGELTPENAALTALIDDGDPNRTRRDAIFNRHNNRKTSWTRAGVGMAKHKVYGKVYIILFATAFVNHKGEQDTVLGPNDVGKAVPQANRPPPAPKPPRPPKAPAKQVLPARPAKDTIPGKEDDPAGLKTPPPRSRSPPPTQRRSPRTPGRGRDDQSASFNVDSASSDDTGFNLDDSTTGEKETTAFSTRKADVKTWPDEKEFAVLAALNKARDDPHALARKIKKDYMSSVVDKDGSIKKACREAIKFLKKQEPLPALKMSLALYWAASDHAVSLSSEGVVSRRGKDGSTPTKRIARYAQVSGHAGECALAGDFDADEIVAWLVIDSQNLKRSNRKTIYAQARSNEHDGDWKCVGIGVYPHSTYSQLCVIDFATDVQTSKGRDYIDIKGYVNATTTSGSESSERGAESSEDEDEGDDYSSDESEEESDSEDESDSSDDSDDSDDESEEESEEESSYAESEDSYSEDASSDSQYESYSNEQSSSSGDDDSDETQSDDSDSRRRRSKRGSAKGKQVAAKNKNSHKKGSQQGQRQQAGSRATAPARQGGAQGQPRPGAGGPRQTGPQPARSGGQQGRQQPGQEPRQQQPPGGKKKKPCCTVQ